jgi:hypothetical protein
MATYLNHLKLDVQKATAEMVDLAEQLDFAVYEIDHHTLAELASADETDDILKQFDNCLKAVNEHAKVLRKAIRSLREYY